VLEGDASKSFLHAFRPFQRKLARIGVVHSLSQTLLKLASPGVPDFFQGCELWDFHLVDPDNRKPVDYAVRARLLQQIRSRLQAAESRSRVARSLFERPQDGAIKLYLIMSLLEHRRAHVDLYQRGHYHPLEAEGARGENVVAFARAAGGMTVVAVAARLVSGMMGEDASRMPLGHDSWGDTELQLYDSCAAMPFRDLLTDRRFAPALRRGHNTLKLAEVFSDLPMAILVSDV
jgi:(1->4)-alpha-D-glucan 1-alpha-D-glucosylmutase